MDLYKISKPITPSLIVAATGLWIATMAQIPAQAADQDARERGVLEEIVVTGTKREVSAQDVPIALTAISEEQLKNQFRTDILALTEMSPSVVLGQMAGFRALSGGIRGTGQNSILVTQDASVVLLVDEFAMSNVQAQFVELFDVDRIEIYRGPQGTLFGKSATGGVISITTKRPDLTEYFADLEVQYGTFDGDNVPDTATIRKYRAAINIPLISDTLAMRATVLWDQDDGYYSNDKTTSDQTVGLIPGLFGGAPLPSPLDGPAIGGGENLGNTDVFASKVKLLWTPTDNYEAYFIWSHLDDNSGAVPAVNESEDDMLVPALGFPAVRRDFLSTGTDNACFGEAFCVLQGHRVDVEQYQLHQTFTTDAFTWKLLWGHREMAEILPSDYAGEAFMSIFDASRNTSKDQQQLELRVSSSFDGPFNFVAGASWSEEETDMLVYATVGLLSLVTFIDPDADPATVGPFFNADGTLALETDYVTDPTMGGAAQDRTTTAFYFDFSYDLTDVWTVSAGIRYTKDEKDFFRRQNPGGPCTAQTPAKDQVMVDGVCLDRRSNAVSRVGAGYTLTSADVFKLPLPDSVFDIALRTDAEWTETTYRLLVDRSFGENAMAYASYSTGFISGGFTETCSSLVSCLPFSPETNENYEIGFKGQFLDNTLQTNFALYYTEYKDLIRSQVVPFTNKFGTTTQETINVNAGVTQATGLEAEITWIINQNWRLDFNLGLLDHEYDEFVLNGVDLSDNDVPFSPDLKYGISLTYEQSFMQGSMVWNTNFNHMDENEFSVFNSPYTQMSERDLWDANVTYRDGEDRYRITFWAKNLLDERNRNAANSVAGLWNMTNYGRPRSYGLEFAVHFD